MIDALYIGASGMHAQQANIDITANNLANVNTSGFKKNKVEFEDLMYRNVSRTNALQTDSGNTYSIGSGAAIVFSGKVFSSGDLKISDSSMDLAIKGQGFFEVIMPNGSMAYTRQGSLQVNGDGLLVAGNGRPLSAMIHVPSDMRSLIVKEDGIVLAEVPGESQPVEIGQIELASFTNPGGLDALGDNLYAATDKSGTAYHGKPGDLALGAIAQGYTEASNVRLIEEMVNLVMAQRAYEINSKVVQASDDILRINNSLYR